MCNKVRYFILFVFLISLSQISYGQFSLTQHPPEPTAQDGLSSVPGEECAGTDPTQGNPPPVGLCLPIDDYLIPLFISGILFGIYKIRKIESVSRG